ncbi:DUF4013 domain-containing protein [Methanobrevibacter sp.]|uniref:DUF4013 domain-containing protein n=1 Tax=Methanobrevibacter sp. TaxID=66852 RepID=UPI00388D608E
MKLFVGHIKESIDYALSDILGLVIISSLVSIACFINKNSLSDPILKVINIFLLIVVGYGSYVSWYALKGRDEHPRFKNNMRRLVWEGFKKSVIVFIYSGFLWLLARLAKQNYADGNLIFTVCFIILFVLLYLCLIAGLLNRYLHKRKFIEAFNLLEIIELIKIFDTQSFIKVIIAVMISQAFAASVVIPFSQGFSLIDIIYSIATFFLAPFLYIATKRFIALNVYDLLEKQS